VLIFWHYFTSPFEIDRVNMNLMLCPGLLRTKRCLVWQHTLHKQ
jgi:hypothetical protein